MHHGLSPASKPTMYFIGVSTRQSSINAVFPRWAERLGLGDCELRGLDFPLHDRPENYRAVVELVRRDPRSLGALVTSHKIDVCSACLDLFDAVEPVSRALGEISSIYKREGRLLGRAVDPWTSGHALDAFLPPGRWRSGAEALILGAGGAGSALAWQLAAARRGADRPARIHVADRVAARLEHLRRLHAAWQDPAPMEFHPVARPEEADALVARLPAGSLVVNATGLGKDAPGSPLTDAAEFPSGGFAWEFNYRGRLDFLAQARRQQAARGLHVEDGWIYFLHGWTQIIGDVFERAIPPRGGLFDDLGRIAAAAARG